MISTLHFSSWHEQFSLAQQNSAIEALENGALIYLPNLSFELSNSEKSLLTPDSLKEKSKNISFSMSNDQVRGSQLKGEALHCLHMMIKRFSTQTTQFIHALMPHYQNHLTLGRTSFRPREILGRQTSVRQDDTRLHVDAFPATPNQGKRILRVFTNINPTQARIWHLGEPFETVLKKFKTTFRRPLFGYRTLLLWAKITKSYRCLYDHYMLQLHDHMKLDAQYQNQIQKLEFQFPPGSSWIVMTDVVSHAALSGQHLLEQTLYLPAQAMQNPSLSPLHRLEKIFEKKLT